MGISALLSAPGYLAAQQPATKPAPVSTAVRAKSFSSPQQAVDALVAAADQFDELALKDIFGPGGEDIYLSGEYPQDRKRAADFAALALEKKSVSVDPQKGQQGISSGGQRGLAVPRAPCEAGGQMGI